MDADSEYVYTVLYTLVNNDNILEAGITSSFFPGSSRNTIYNVKPVWARETLFSSMF